MRTSISKLLVANRGEIAVRVMRSCRDLGIATVGVFSEPDRGALHVRLADEAVEIGPAAALESYLNSDAILDAARRTGADAIHPGYGFLSENAGFADACRDAGFLFVGPPAAAIRAMGDKTTARGLMSNAGVPMAPGSPEPVSDMEQASVSASKIGYPLLIKAAAGGGGKGMRLVERPDELRAALETAGREAQSSFGDGRVYIEKYVLEPRHVEIQVLADQHGSVVHLFERECSIQRRHQKVIEEAPSPALDDDLRARMGDAAVAAARSCGYESAGTVEFLVDRDRNFYFMEMNTRIQVEHPVTEAITGIDLVAEQIWIAEGQRLRFDQGDLRRSGHAIECRIYAEDPTSDFRPDPGTVTRHKPPSGPGVRLDAGVEEGDEVLVHYDPMIAKLVTWGADRDQAMRRMKRALAEYEVGGVRTTIPFCRYVIDHAAFRRGEVTTQFVDDHFDPRALSTTDEKSARAAALAAAMFAELRSPASESAESSSKPRNGTSLSWLSRRHFR